MVNNSDINIYSVKDVIDTLKRCCECIPEADEDSMYRFASELTGLSEDRLYEFVEDAKARGGDDYIFRYQMLGRMLEDCRYYLGGGNRQEKYLWAGNATGQAAYMLAVFQSFPAEWKPKWTSEQEITDLGRQLGADMNEVSVMACQIARDADANGWEAVLTAKEVRHAC